MCGPPRCRTYGGTAVGDVVLEAAQVPGQLGRSGVPALTHARAVATVPLGPAPPLAADASTFDGTAHRRPLGGGAGAAEAGTRAALFASTATGPPAFRARKSSRSWTQPNPYMIRSGPCQRACKAVAENAAARKAVGNG